MIILKNRICFRRKLQHRINTEHTGIFFNNGINSD
jgi:hypothetical protein